MEDENKETSYLNFNITQKIKPNFQLEDGRTRSFRIDKSKHVIESKNKKKTIKKGIKETIAEESRRTFLNDARSIKQRMSSSKTGAKMMTYTIYHVHQTAISDSASSSNNILNAALESSTQEYQKNDALQSETIPNEDVRNLYSSNSTINCCITSKNPQKITETVYGFAEFITTVGNTIMMFTPNYDSHRGNKHDNRKSTSKLSDSFTFSSFQIQRTERLALEDLFDLKIDGSKKRIKTEKLANQNVRPEEIQPGKTIKKTESVKHVYDTERSKESMIENVSKKTYFLKPNDRLSRIKGKATKKAALIKDTSRLKIRSEEKRRENFTHFKPFNHKLESNKILNTHYFTQEVPGLIKRTVISEGITTVYSTWPIKSLIGTKLTKLITKSSEVFTMEMNEVGEGFAGVVEATSVPHLGFSGGRK